MNGIEQLTSDNHTLFRRVTHLLNLRWKWEAIALEVGIYNVNDIAEWYLDYRSLKPLPMVNAGYVFDVPVRAPSLTSHGVRLAVWQKQRAGAGKALEAIGQ